MTQDHDYIRESLPEYLAGKLPGRKNEDIKRHLDRCVDCSQDLALMNKLRKTEVPDPGELFWKTLPGKVVAKHRNNNQRNSWLTYGIRPVPASAFMLLAALLAVFMSHSINSRQRYYDPLFSDPFSVSSIDYSTLERDSIHEITERLSIHDNVVDVVEDRYFGHSYHEELADLHSDEINNMLKALESQHKNGGVL
ncbi:MAG: zf-HC2 domain-containing protein [Nitrospiraceae bacterium]|nr:MAG: zf-HC2 domain-containing protein [Nitrospiraceae bacterium]